MINYDKLHIDYIYISHLHIFLWNREMQSHPERHPVAGLVEFIKVLVMLWYGGNPKMID